MGTTRERGPQKHIWNILAIITYNKYLIKVGILHWKKIEKINLNTCLLFYGFLFI
jgi:hypothetical protein